MNAIFKKKFSNLYIPKKKLNFIIHQFYGKVYPVYLADKDFKNDKKNKIVAGLAFGALALNSYFLFLNLGVFTVSKATAWLISSSQIVVFSCLLNFYWIKTYISNINQLVNRVKAIYLLPTGDKIVLEKFDNTVDIVKNIDIYFSNFYCTFDEKDRKEKIYDYNHSSVMIQMHYGRNKEVLIKGKRIILDYEILNNILTRKDIDTSQIEYNSQLFDKHIPRSFINENKKLYEYIKKNIYKKKIRFNKLKLSYTKYKKQLKQENDKFINWI